MSLLPSHKGNKTKFNNLLFPLIPCKVVSRNEIATLGRVTPDNQYFAGAPAASGKGKGTRSVANPPLTANKRYSRDKLA